MVPISGYGSVPGHLNMKGISPSLSLNLVSCMTAVRSRPGERDAVGDWKQVATEEVKETRVLGSRNNCGRSRRKKLVFPLSTQQVSHRFQVMRAFYIQLTRSVTADIWEQEMNHTLPAQEDWKGRFFITEVEGGKTNHCLFHHCELIGISGNMEKVNFKIHTPVMVKYGWYSIIP